jgi:hypothetical protein
MQQTKSKNILCTMVTTLSQMPANASAQRVEYTTSINDQFALDLLDQISTMAPNSYLHDHILVQSVQCHRRTNTTLFISAIPVLHVLHALGPCS